MKYRPLTKEEVLQIQRAKDLISFYRTGIALEEAKIEMIKDAPQMEYWKMIALEPMPEF